MLEITTAARIIDTEVDRQLGRRAARETPAMRAIYRAFVSGGGPVRVNDFMSPVPTMSRDAVACRLAALDEDDVVQVVNGQVEIAYPFTDQPTPFVVRLAVGGERYACCAIAPRSRLQPDALGRVKRLQRKWSRLARPGPAKNSQTKQRA